MPQPPAPEELHRLIRQFLDAESSGFFVEVGAGHPIEGSQTWHLERAGWTGLLIEPQPDLAAFLAAGRKARVFAVACAGPEQTDQPMSLRVAARARAGEPPSENASEYVVTVPTRTLDELLEEADAPVPIDFLSLDIGGGEAEVLNGLDLGHWQPQLILLGDHAGRWRAHRSLIASGYRLVLRQAGKAVYVPAADAKSIGARGQTTLSFYLALPWRGVRDGARRLVRRLADWWAVR